MNFQSLVENYTRNILRNEGSTPPVQGYVQSVDPVAWTCTVRVPNAFAGIDAASHASPDGTYLQLEDVPLPRSPDGVIIAVHNVWSGKVGVSVGFKGRGGGQWFPYIAGLLNLDAQQQALTSVDNRSSVVSSEFGVAGPPATPRPVVPGGRPRMTPLVVPAPIPRVTTEPVQPRDTPVNPYRNSSMFIQKGLPGKTDLEKWKDNLFKVMRKALGDFK